MKALAAALNDRLKGQRIESVQMPDKHTLVFPIGRTPDALLICVDPTANALALVQAPKREAAQLRHPFRDLLAARLAGGTIVGIGAPLGERVVLIDVRSHSRIGDRTEVRLVVELFGSRADLALVEGEQVVESLRRRRLEPKDAYQEPSPAVDPSRPGVGGPPLVLREYGHLAEGDSTAARSFWERVWSEPGQFSPVRLENLSPPFYPIPLSHRPEPQPAVLDFLVALSQAVQSEREEADLERRRRTLLARQEAALTRLWRTEQDLLAALSAAKEAGVLRRQAESLLTMVTTLPPEASQFTYTDWESGDARTVALDPSQSHAATAQSWFKEARRITTRCKRAEALLPDVQAKLEAGILARDEIASATELPKEDADHGAGRRPSAAPARPYHTVRTKAGHQVRIGRTQQGNDLLLHLARPADLWLHAHGIPGSHVILSSQGGVGEADKEAAALLAAYFSKGRQARNVLVDCTLRRHVRKRPKSAPGLVLFDHEETFQVTPAGALLDHLLAQLE